MKGISIGTMLISVLMSFAGKIITALGVGFISYSGIDYMQTKFAAWTSQQLGNFPADAMQIFYIGGGEVFLKEIRMRTSDLNKYYNKTIYCKFFTV